MSADLITKITQAISNNDIVVTFSDEETISLNEHFQNDNMNQYILIIVDKILKVKTYKEDRDKVVLFLTSKIADIMSPLKDLKNDALFIANVIYKILYVIDISEIEHVSF